MNMENLQQSGRLAICVEVIRDLEGFARLEADWNILFERAYNAAPPLHYDWVATWLEIYGPIYVAAEEGLRIICCRRQGELVAIMPLYLRRQQHVSDGGVCLSFASTGESVADEICPDYMDMLCLAEVEDACAELVWITIIQQMGGSYDRLEFSDMANHSPLVNWARGNGALHDLEISPRGVCCISDLTGGMDAYFSRLSHKMRAQCRRVLRAADDAGVKFSVAGTMQESKQYFDELVTIHQRRWTSAGEAGCFSSALFSDFHRKLSEKWVPEKKAVLSRIRLGDETLAVKYGFCLKGKFDFYQSGVCVEESATLKSPGTASILMLMRHLVDEGITSFDFLRGAAGYKQRLATTATPLVQVRRILWTWRTSFGFAASIGSRAVRKAGRVAMRKRVTTRPRAEEE